MVKRKTVPHGTVFLLEGIIVTMKCKRCGADLLEGVEKCPVCGFSEKEAQARLDKELESVTVSKNSLVNQVYAKIFGNTDKRVVKRLLKWVAVILFFIWLFYHFFLYIDIPNRCFITLRPALIEMSNTTIKKGIRYLKSDYPQEYKNFCKNVKTVNPNISCGGFGGGCYSEYKLNSGVIDISTPYGNWKAAAKVIIHETCHAMQFKEGRPFDETECYAKDAIIPWR